MRIGFANGCFDCFHEGHKHFLIECRRRCDYLIVAVNTDESVRRIKGVLRPVNNLALRMMRVNSYADATIPTDGRISDLIRAIRPAVILRGSDQRDNGVKWAPIEWILRLPEHSTTAILARHEAKSDAPNIPPGMP